MTEKVTPARSAEERLPELIDGAYAAAPTIRELFDSAGVRPEEVRRVADLARLPVTPKDRLLALQRERPPFGGFLGVDRSEIGRVFVSPGPIYEPDTDARPGQGYGAAFAKAGVGRGDVVLNTWSYHLVPAGLVLDEAFRSVGATVIPGGVGNSELQAQIMIEMGVTVVAASTAFFQTLIDAIKARGHRLPADWELRAALLGGEFGNWAAKRRSIEERFEIQTFSVYGTGDVGLIGYECPRQDGYHVGSDVLVQVCDPASGQPLPDGESGEVVVTSINPVWPLIRFGTGDASMLIPGACACGDTAPKLAPLLGRTGQSVKVREIFVYPRHMDEIRARVEGVAAVQGTARRRNGRDEVDLSLVLDAGVGLADVERAVRDAFTAVTRLRPGAIETMDALEPGAPFLVNEIEP